MLASEGIAMHMIIAEFLGTALMIVFGVGVHCDEVLEGTKYHGSGHVFAISTWAFGITICLYLFGKVCINPAMVVAQAILGNIEWSMVLPYEVAGGVFGAVLVWVCYADHFKASEGSVDPVRIRNIFCTSPGIRNLPRNFFCEFLATFIFIAGIIGIVNVCSTTADHLVPIAVGLLVWAVGMGLGGTTGFAMNLARDMGPRIAHAILPIKGKADSDWVYGIVVPGIAPFLGAVCAAFFMRAFLGA